MRTSNADAQFIKAQELYSHLSFSRKIRFLVIMYVELHPGLSDKVKRVGAFFKMHPRVGRMAYVFLIASMTAGILFIAMSGWQWALLAGVLLGLAIGEIARSMRR